MVSKKYLSKMQCELCGSNKNLVKAVVEDSTLNVCLDCARFGKVISTTKQEKIIARHKEDKPEEIEIIVDDYTKLIKSAREKINLKQEELAKKISEKVSVIHAIESGHLEPEINLAKKLERFLDIRLIKKIRAASMNKKETKISGLTIGDIIKIKDE